MSIEQGVEPPKAQDPEPEKPKYTREDSELLAQRIMLLRGFVMEMDGDHLKAAIDELKGIKSRDDALGCLLKPDGYAERSDVHEVQIEFLELLLKLHLSQMNLEKALLTQKTNKGKLQETLKHLGLDF